MSPVLISSLRRPPTPGVRITPPSECVEPPMSRSDGESVWNRLSEHMSSTPDPLVRGMDYDDADSTHSSPPGSPPPLEPMTTEEMQALIRSLSYTSYIPPGTTTTTSNLPRDYIPIHPLASPYHAEHPYSTQRRLTNWEHAPTSPPPSALPERGSPEWFMEQFICFIYRGNAIWLRVSAAMDDGPGAPAVPSVSVRFVTELHANDPALHRIGFILERQLQENMQREICSAVRQIVGFRASEDPGLSVLVPEV